MKKSKLTEFLLDDSYQTVSVIFRMKAKDRELSIDNADVIDINKNDYENYPRTLEDILKSYGDKNLLKDIESIQRIRYVPEAGIHTSESYNGFYHRCANSGDKYKMYKHTHYNDVQFEKLEYVGEITYKLFIPNLVDEQRNIVGIDTSGDYFIYYMVTEDGTLIHIDDDFQIKKL